jgi:hypothetical protein
MSNSSSTVTRQTAFEDLPEQLRVDEYAAHLGVSEWWVRQHIACGDIPAQRIGKLIFIPRIILHPNHAGTTAMTPQADQINQTDIGTPSEASKVAYLASKSRMSPAKRRKLVREVATQLLREALDKVHEQEREEREAEVCQP